MHPGLALPGRYRQEAEWIKRFCLDRGMSWKRAYVLACAASLGRTCWAFQATLADFTGYSVSTVFRAFRQAKKLGLIVSRRLRVNEQPEGSDRPISCGGAFRRFVSWGMTPRRMVRLCLQYAARWIYREQAVEARAERERAELARAVADFRALAPP
jgi:hypothetical protein